MNCDAGIDLVLFSNGALACGKVQHRDWVSFDPSLDYWNDVIAGKVFEDVRHKLRSQEMPFGDHCIGCAVLNEAHPQPALNGRIHIQTFEVEPTVSCNISCTGCEKIENRKNYRSKGLFEHTVLTIENFVKILSDIEGKLDIGTFNFQGWGEPTLNKSLGLMSKVAKQKFPSANIQLVTNAQGKHFSKQFDHAFDTVVFSIDGTDQASYEKYRSGGDFISAVEFMKKHAEERIRAKNNVKHVWKYILFEHSSSEEQLEKLFYASKDLGMDELCITFTQYGPVAKRFFPTSQFLREITSTRSLCDVNDVIEFDTAVNFCAKFGHKIPLPECFFQAPKNYVTFSVVMSSTENILKGVDIIKYHLETGKIHEARRFLERSAFMLWNLYRDVGLECMSDKDRAVAKHLLQISNQFSEADRIVFNNFFKQLQVPSSV